MKRLVLACGILVGMVSVSLGAMSKEEWDRASYNCLENEDKSACQALINHSIEMGWGSLEQCSKDNCAFVGAVYGAAGRYREAIPYFEKAIALGDNRGYILLGKTYDKLQDYYNAKKYYEIACDTNDVAYACLVVAELYDRGQGVKQNSSTATQYYHKACNLGDQRACGAIKAKRFEAMLRFSPESQQAIIEEKKRELELKKLELQNKELEQKLQKYR